MSEHDHDSRWALGTVTDDRALLTGFLDFQRDALARKLAGLSPEQLRTRSVPPSQISLIGLVRHLATVERWYFQNVLAGVDAPSLYVYETNEAFLGVDGADCDADVERWRRECEASSEVVATRPLDAMGTIPGTDRALTARWIVMHMIDEYARHLGHADLVREAIDGTTGE